MKNSKDNPNGKQYDSRTNAGVTKFANWVVKRRWFIVIGAAMLAMTAGSGMQYLSFNNDYHIFFDAQNPTLLAFDALQDWMGDFVGISRIALESKPQYLEMLGIVESS